MQLPWYLISGRGYLGNLCIAPFTKSQVLTDDRKRPVPAEYVSFLFEIVLGLLLREHSLRNLKISQNGTRTLSVSDKVPLPVECLMIKNSRKTSPIVS